MKNNKIYTYATTRAFGSFFMPVPAQNACNREYSNHIGMAFVFPLVELYYENCFAQLFRLLEAVPDRSSLCCYSALMLPQSSRKINIVKKILDNKKLEFHFVFEKKIAVNPEDIDSVISPYEFGALISDEGQFSNFLI